MKSIKSIVLMIVCVLPAHIADSCAYEALAEDTRFWTFSTLLPEYRSIMEYGYSAERLLRTDNYREHKNAPSNHEQTNCEEWFQKLGQGISKEHIYKTLYATHPSAYFVKADSGQEIMTTCGLAVNKDLADYLRFAKRCEMLINHPDPWSFDSYNRDPASTNVASHRDLSRAASFGEKLLAHSTDAFAKQRIAFQLCRINFYLKKTSAQDTLYREYFRATEASHWMSAMASFYRAQQLQGPQSCIELARIFNYPHDRRARIIELITAQKESLSEAISITEDVTIKASLLAIREIRNPGPSLKAIRTIHSLDPASPMTKMLVNREVNKIEDWLTSYDLTRFDDSSQYMHVNDNNGNNTIVDDVKKLKKTDTAYLHTLIKFLDNESWKDDDERAYMKLCCAHLQMLAENGAAALKCLGEARSNPFIQSHLMTQIMVEEVMIDFVNHHGMTEANGQRFMALYNALFTGSNYDDPSKLISNLAHFISLKFEQTGRTEEAFIYKFVTHNDLGPSRFRSELNYSRDDPWSWLLHTGTPKTCTNIFNKLNAKNKSSYESWLSSFVRLERWDTKQDSTAKYKVLTIASSMHLRDNNATAALNVLKAIPDEWYWNMDDLDCMDVFLFSKSTSDQGRRGTDFIEKSKRRFNRKTFLKELVALEKLYSNNVSENGMVEYQLANAWFSLTRFGHNWNGIYLEKSFVEEFERSTLNDNYAGCEKAIHFYREALKKLRKRETAVICYYALNFCERQQYIYRNQSTGKVFRHDDQVFEYHWSAPGSTARSIFKSRYRPKDDELTNCAILGYYYDQSIAQNGIEEYQY